jgi:exopolysaccharide production protein ExoQ
VGRLTARKYDAVLLSVTAAITPTVGVLAPLGLAPLLAAVAIGLVLIDPRSRTELPAALRPAAILVTLMALWAGLSTLWSIVPEHSVLEAARFALVSAMGIIVASAALTLDADGRAAIGRASIIGLVVGIAIVSIEWAGDFPIRRAALHALYPIPIAVLDRGSNVLALACWLPILYLLQAQRSLAGAVVFATTFLVVSRLTSLSATLSMVVAAATYVLAWRRPCATAMLVIFGFVALTMIMPFWAPTRATVLWLNEEVPSLRHSAEHRLAIWRFASDRIVERAFLGWGIDASRAIPGGHESANSYMNLPAASDLTGEVMPLHPHNAILQLWLELGMVGSLLGVGLASWIVWRGGAGDQPNSRSVALAAVAAATAPLLLSFGIWQAWWQSALWLIASFMLAIRQDHDRASHSSPSDQIIASSLAASDG